MELKKAGEWIQATLKKENTLRLVVVLGICGIALLALSSFDFSKEEGPEPRPEEAASDTAYAQALEQDLARIVSAITGERGGEKESAHVVLEDREGAQRPLTVTQVQPKIQGVVIVSARAQDPATREKLVNAAKTVLGIPSSRVCVTSGG